MKQHELNEISALRGDDPVIVLLLQEIQHLREENKHMKKLWSRKHLPDSHLANIQKWADKAHGGFMKDHTYGAVNLVNGADMRKDLAFVMKQEDASFYSAAKEYIRLLSNEIRRLNEIQTRPIRQNIAML